MGKKVGFIYLNEINTALHIFAEVGDCSHEGSLTVPFPQPHEEVLLSKIPKPF